MEDNRSCKYSKEQSRRIQALLLNTFNTLLLVLLKERFGFYISGMTEIRKEGMIYKEGKKQGKI